MNSYAATFLATVSMVRTIHAHPGHGASSGSYSFWHYVSEPEHIAALTALVIVGLVMARLMPSRRGWNQT